MSFSEFYCTVKATGNGYDFFNEVVTFNNIMDIVLKSPLKGDISTVVLQREAWPYPLIDRCIHMVLSIYVKVSA